MEGKMGLHLIDADAPAKLRAAYEAGTLRRGSWGDGVSAVCMMSAMSGKSEDECVTRGWPQWLVSLNVSLFDANVGAEDELKASYEFAAAVADAVSVPRDYDKARDLFLISRLDAGDHSALKSLRLNPVDSDWWRACEVSIQTVVGLLHRRVNGEDVADEMVSADAAAYAAWAAAYAAYAARAAAYAASAAAYAARAARAARAAARAADAAADAAAYAAAYAARAADAAAYAARAARAAARADLISALLAA